MRNVTITLDEETAPWLRLEAAERNTSVSRLVGELLRERMTGDRSYETAIPQAEAASPEKRGGAPETRGAARSLSSSLTRTYSCMRETPRSRRSRNRLRRGCSSYGVRVADASASRSCTSTTSRCPAGSAPDCQRQSQKKIRALMEWNPVATDASLLESAWRIEAAAKISFWDALIVAAASASGCTMLLTEDLQEGAEPAGVLVVNPFRTLPGDDRIHDRTR